MMCLMILSMFEEMLIASKSTASCADFKSSLAVRHLAQTVDKTKRFVPQVKPVMGNDTWRSLIKSSLRSSTHEEQKAAIRRVSGFLGWSKWDSLTFEGFLMVSG